MGEDRSTDQGTGGRITAFPAVWSSTPKCSAIAWNAAPARRISAAWAPIRWYTGTIGGSAQPSVSPLGLRKSQLPVEPPHGVRRRVVIDAEVFRDRVERRTTGPQLRRLSRDPLVHWRRGRISQLDVEGGKVDVAHALEGSLDGFLAGCRDRDAA